MLERERPDAVSVLVPVSRAAEVALHVMHCGIPLLLEKPPGATPAETRCLIRAADEYHAANQVAYNRRYMSLMREAVQSLAGETIQFVEYDMFRYERPDVDFAVTAIHAIDAVSWITGSAYRSVRFTYTPALAGHPDVVNIFLEGYMESGTFVRIQICPMSGVVCERASVHLSDRCLSLRFPIFESAELPGSLTDYRLGKAVRTVSGAAEEFIANGFRDENRSFFDTVRAGGYPADDLRSGWQSACIANCIRRRIRAWDSENGEHI